MPRCSRCRRDRARHPRDGPSLYRRYRHDGGNADFPAWESAEGLVSLENAPGPALVAKRLLEGVLKHEVPPRDARFLNSATHWGFGLGRRRRVRTAARLAAHAEAVVRTSVRRRGVGSGYVVLPLLGVYKPIWKYNVETLAKDLSAHLVFGSATTAAFSLLARKESP